MAPVYAILLGLTLGDPPLISLISLSASSYRPPAAQAEITEEYVYISGQTLLDFISSINSTALVHSSCLSVLISMPRDWFTFLRAPFAMAPMAAL